MVTGTCGKSYVFSYVRKSVTTCVRSPSAIIPTAVFNPVEKFFAAQFALSDGHAAS